jgi:predicted GTPase
MTNAFDRFNSRRHEVIEALGSLEGHASSVGASSLASRIGRNVIDKLRADQFHLVVVGEFNHGKSTFVNALLGTEALPTGVTPTTALIHHVVYGEEPGATVFRAEGEPEVLAFAKLQELVAKGEEVADGADETIKHVEVRYPAEFLKERIVLVDTPGVNDLNLQRADITYKYIPQSDAVLFVIDAGQPLKESERLFLKEKLLGQSRDKIIFVVGKADIWSADEKAEALAYVEGELGKLIEGPVVFPVSAHKALAGDREGSGIGPLVRHLTGFLAEERGRIMLTNALGEGLEAARTLSHSIDARRRAASMSVAEIERRIAHIEVDMEGQAQTLEERRAAIREEGAAIRAWVRRDVDRFCDDVIRQLPAIIEAPTADELRIHLPGFLERTFVDWAQLESGEVAKALEDLAEKTVILMRENAHDSAKRLSDGTHGDVPPPDIHVDTFGYDLGVAALISVGIGMFYTNVVLGALMTGAAPVLAYYLKGRVETETKNKAQEQATVALREAASKVSPKLDEMITQFTERLEAWVVDAGKEVHREMIDILRAAKGKHEVEAPNAKEIAQECEDLVEELERVRGRLDELKKGMWSDTPVGDSA